MNLLSLKKKKRALSIDRHASSKANVTTVSKLRHKYRWYNKEHLHNSNTFAKQLLTHTAEHASGRRVLSSWCLTTPTSAKLIFIHHLEMCKIVLNIYPTLPRHTNITISHRFNLEIKRIHKGKIDLDASTYTLAWGFFLEKSQARPRSEIRTWPCSSNRILAGCGAKRRTERVMLMMGKSEEIRS